MRVSRYAEPQPPSTLHQIEVTQGGAVSYHMRSSINPLSISGSDYAAYAD